MADRGVFSHRSAGLRGRSLECAQLDQLLEAVRSGEGRSLVVCGEPGIGKTALLEYLVESASDMVVLRAGGVESEMELAFAGLHQLFFQLRDRLDRVSGAQLEALEVVFGLRSGAAPDRLLVALAVLGLLSELAVERPLLCVVDDAQWLDTGSTLALGIVARRLVAERIGLVFATREPSQELLSLPTLEVRGLRYPDARALLASSVEFTLDEQVREQIIAETRGNPLALIELPRRLTSHRPDDDFGRADAQRLSAQIEESYVRRAQSLSDDGGRLLLLAAADPVGDPLLLWRAAERLGVAPAAADEVDAHGLLTIGDRVTFRHPLVRSAVISSAPAPELRAAHRALAEATDGDTDPDRRAWHLAAATVGRDEEIALELERSAARAQARGGFSAAAAFRQRALALTAEPAKRGERALAAAESCMWAGLFDAAHGLLSTAEAGELDDRQQAQVKLLRGRIALFSRRPSSDAPALLMTAAQSLEPHDLGLARDTYLDAWGAALYAGRLGAGGDLLEVSRAARSAPRPEGLQRPADLLLDSLAMLVTGGLREAAVSLRKGTRTVVDTRSPPEASRSWTWLAVVPTNALWDEENTYAICDRLLRELREAGALGRLPHGLHTYCFLATRCGHLDDAAAALAESEAIIEATGAEFGYPVAKALLAVFRGRETEATALIQSTEEEATAFGHGAVVQANEWAAAILYNSLGRYEEAFAAAERGSGDSREEQFMSPWALVELVEAATRSGNRDAAEIALRRVVETTAVSTTDSARGISARCRALLSEGAAAEGLYEEAVERLGRSRLRPDLARAHLLYGEWLRREGRRLDAREQLRAGYDRFKAMGMEAFAGRAERELSATGERSRKRVDETRADLTAQEAQIAGLAREGLSNTEIGARLFLSPRTVEWHLHHVFTKLGISSRKQLRDAPPRV
jgi:DNA-binding NarL/FixJ family response regulator